MIAAIWTNEDQAKVDARIDADMAEYEFNLYCTSGPGVVAADVVANMVAKAHTKAFWDAAKYQAMTVRTEWLAA